MFIKEINFISDLNLNKLQILGDKFTIEEIKKSKIHPAIFQFISATIDKEIFSDREKIKNDSICDYNADRISNYFMLIAEEIKRTQLFSMDYIKQILQNAVVFNINYLTRPNRTLTNLIFGDFTVKSSEEIIVGISHAYYYRFLKKILLTYLDKKKVLLMSRDEFIALLKRIDVISKETHLENTITTAVNSMANFFGSNSKNSARLSLQAIKLYLNEKELPEFVNRIEVKFGIDNTALFMASDIINELRSVTPETEIDIQQTIDVEDNLIIDESDNNQFKNNEIDNEEPSSIITSEGFDEINNSKVIDTEEIFEVDKEDVEIPNHEILSNNQDIEQNKEVILETPETLDEIEENPIEKIEVIEELNPVNSDIDNVDEISEETEDAKNDIEEDSKKNFSAIHLLNDLVDLDPVYDSLLTPIEPFNTQIDSIELIDNLSEEINYEIDLSTIKEEIDIRSIKSSDTDINYTSSNEDADKVFQNNNLIEDNSSTDNLEVDVNLEAAVDQTYLDEYDDFDINSTIDEVVNQDLIEEEFLKENQSLEVVNSDFDETEKFENSIDEDKLFLDEEESEEITEVFTDLVFLDSDEIDEKSNVLENTTTNHSIETVNEEYEELNQDEEILEHSSSYENFSDMISSKDMTKIIEVIFDYDMEDYHTAIDQISNSTSEHEANRFIDEYCNNTHVEITSNEVELFKMMILEYFTQTYS